MPEIGQALIDNFSDSFDEDDIFVFPNPDQPEPPADPLTFKSQLETFGARHSLQNCPNKEAFTYAMLGILLTFPLTDYF